MAKITVKLRDHKSSINHTELGLQLTGHATAEVDEEHPTIKQALKSRILQKVAAPVATETAEEAAPVEAEKPAEKPAKKTVVMDTAKEKPQVEEGK